jgi:hypothetical protein
MLTVLKAAVLGALLALGITAGSATAGGLYSEQASRLRRVYAEAEKVSLVSPDGKSKVVVSVRVPDAD